MPSRRRLVLGTVCVATTLGTVFVGLAGLWVLGTPPQHDSEASASSWFASTASTTSGKQTATAPPKPSQAQTSAFSLVTNQIYSSDDTNGVAKYGVGLVANGEMAFSYGGVGITPGSSAGEGDFGDTMLVVSNIGVASPSFTYGNTNDNLNGRAFHTATVFKDQLIYIGGVDTNSGSFVINGQVLTSPLNSQAMPILLTNGVKWPPRFAHATVVLSDRLVVMGGASTSEDLNDVWLSLDGKVWEQAPVQPVGSIWEPRHGHAAVVLNGTIYLFGGMVGQPATAGVVVNDLWCSSDAVEWTQLRATNTPFDSTSSFFTQRYLHAAAVYHDYIYVTGGCGTSVSGTSVAFIPYYDVWRSADGTHWEQATAYAAWAKTDALGNTMGRCGHNLIVGDEKLFVVTGTTIPGLNNPPAYTAAYYDMWTALPELDCLVDGVECAGVGTCGPPDIPSGTSPSDFGKYPRLCECNGTYGGLFCAGCKAGHYGTTCVQCDVVSGTGVVCNGHGQCDGDGTRGGTGVCACDLGWTLESNCTQCSPGFGPAGSCDTCLSGFYGNTCEACAPCSGAHKQCDGSGTRSGTGACVCETGWSGDDCDTCADHFQPPNCDTCVTGFYPPGVCDTCETGYYGPNCDACPTCGAHSYCDGSGTTTGSGECTCDAGWAPPGCTTCVTGRTGSDCTECSEGYYGSDCTPCPGLSTSGGSTTVCNGHGTCDGSGTTSGTGVCSCVGSFKGSACAECPIGSYGPTCAQCPYACVHGTCNGTGTITGNGACVCSSKEWGGTLCNTCEPPYTTSVDDDGAGCFCRSPYAGSNCQDCSYGQWGPTCSNSCLSCQNGGTFVGCQSQASGAHCECTEAYSGSTCTTCSSIAISSSGGCYVCPVDSSGTVCGGHGTCVAPAWPQTTTSCACTYPWTGTNCTTEIPPVNHTGSHSGTSDDDAITTPQGGSDFGEIIAIIAGVVAVGIGGACLVKMLNKKKQAKATGPGNAPLLQATADSGVTLSPQGRRPAPPPPPPSRSAASGNPTATPAVYSSQAYHAQPQAQVYGGAGFGAQSGWNASSGNPGFGGPSMYGGNMYGAQQMFAQQQAMQQQAAAMHGMGVPVSQGMYGSGNYGGNPYGAGAGAGAPAAAPAPAPAPAAAPHEGKEAEEEAAAAPAAPKGTLPEVKWEELDGMTKLGQGSFGVVHKARWRGTLVAVKVPMSQGEDIGEEAAILQKVANHPNVLSLIGLCHHPFQAMVLPFMDKGSMEDMLVLPGRSNVRDALPWRTAVDMLVQAAAGVLHLHREGVIHRDLACRNLLVDAHNRVCVADFGMARAKEAARSEGFTRTLTGPIKWEAPECLARKPGEKPFNSATDVFSFAVTMHEVVSGSPPWPGKDNRFAGRAVVNGIRMPIPDGDPVVASLIEDCWAQDPEARPQMAQVVRRLSAHLDNGAVPAGSVAQVFSSSRGPAPSAPSAGGASKYA